VKENTMISGRTVLIAHIGYPTENFKAPMIYNPWFASRGIDAVVVPMGVRPEDYADALSTFSRLTNLRGALVTMPHKVSTLQLAHEVSAAARIAGAANALLKRPDGTWLADQFDGDGFTRGVKHKGRPLAGARVIISGCGGVGSAIAASIAREGPASISLFDADGAAADALRERLLRHYPSLVVSTGSNDPAGHDVVVNATPLGMREGDPLPFDVSRIALGSFVGDVVMKSEYTPFLSAARERGCQVQVGSDMLFEMIPAYLEFFGFGSATPDELRSVAQISY
jgi:shikimate dehydrogenase